MSFSQRDLRRGLDVFSADGIYLGTVVKVIYGAPAVAAARATVNVPADGAGGSAFSGEALGPMPTAALGNDGPARQTHATQYAATPSATPSATTARPAELLVFRWLVALNWDTLVPRLRRIPVSLVQSVSHERVALTVTAADLS